MLSLLAYGLTFGQAQADSELMLPELSSFCTDIAILIGI
jgi:hypothetical protein